MARCSRWSVAARVIARPALPLHEHRNLWPAPHTRGQRHLCLLAAACVTNQHQTLRTGTRRCGDGSHEQLRVQAGLKRRRLGCSGTFSVARHPARGGRQQCHAERQNGHPRLAQDHREARKPRWSKARARARAARRKRVDASPLFRARALALFPVLIVAAHASALTSDATRADVLCRLPLTGRAPAIRAAMRLRGGKQQSSVPGPVVCVCARARARSGADV